MKRIVVFCGSATGSNDAFVHAAEKTGEILAQRGIELIYGGGAIGLMGVVADSVLKHGGKVTGVIPKFLATKEIAHRSLTNLEVVESMHERKARMNELSDGVIVLPGGIGTMEEFFEMFTWGQLGLHRKPIAILNVIGFYDPLIHLVTRMTDHGFVKHEHQHMLLVHEDTNALIDAMLNYQPPALPTWITDSET